MILLVVHEIHINVVNLSNITSRRSSSFVSINLKPKMKLFQLGKTRRLIENRLCKRLDCVVRGSVFFH